MGFNLLDELIATPPKLTLTSFPSHKPLPATPGALTPPLQPMVSVPFEWEEVPGRPRPITMSSPSKPKSFRCLELPPRLLAETKVAHVPTSPTTVLDGPKVGRTLSHRFFLEDISPNILTDNYSLGLNDGQDQRKSESELRSDFGPWRWASGDGPKWDQTLDKPIFDFYTSWDKSKSVRSDIDIIDVRMRRFRRTKGSLYKLSCKSSRFIDHIYRSLRRMVGCKEGKLRTGARDN